MSQEQARQVGRSTGNLGMTIAAIISYAKWHSIGWAILHGIFGWVYVLYYVVKF